jgi:hypothetical protein
MDQDFFDLLDQAKEPVVEDERVRDLKKVHRRGWARAQLWHQRLGRVSEVCGVRCSRGMWKDQTCPNRAGLNTYHDGWGPCWVHGGAKWSGRAESGWIMAHAYAAQLNVSPWDALLLAVRIAAGKVAYTEQVLAEATDDRELDGRWARDENGILVDPTSGEPLGVGAFRDRSWWVAKNEYWTRELAKTAKMAIDAGVAERMVEAQVLQVQLIARPIEKVLQVLGLSPEQEMLARATMRKELQSIEAEQAQQGGTTLDGTGWFKELSPEDL